MKKNRRSGAVSYASLRKHAMSDQAFRREYAAQEPEFALIRAVLHARMRKGLTQATIAKRMGTTQSAIARFEAGKANPTLDFATRLSHALGARLEIRLAP